MQVYLTNNRTGKPIKNGKIAYYQGDTISMMSLVGVYATDQNGMANVLQENKEKTFQLIESKEKPFKLVASHKNDRFVFDSRFSRVLKGDVSLLPKASFFTDRSIYRPGQTIYYKAICFVDQQPLKDQAVIIELSERGGKEIASQELTTDEFGAVHGSFVLPQGLLNGDMRLKCFIGKKWADYGYFAFRVEEYKRPTFEIVFPPIEGNYRLNDTVSIIGKANALAGYAIDNAHVAYRVVREEQARFGYWNRPFDTLKRGQREIVAGTTITQNDGSFTIAFKAVADDLQDNRKIYYYIVTADVTDANGETRSAEQTIKISHQSLFIKADIPEKIIRRDSLDFDLTTTNLNDDFTPAEVAVTLSELQSPKRILHDRLWSSPDTLMIARAEFEKSFPFDAYGDEAKPEKFPIVRQIAEYKLHTAQDKKISLDALKQAKAGWYKLDIKARVPGMEEAEEKQVFFQLIGTPSGNNTPITNMKDWLIVVKNRCEPGENMEFLVAGGYPKSYIYYEIILNDRVVERKSIVTGTTSQRLVFPVKEEYRGGVSVRFVMMHNQRLYERNVYVSVPFTNKKLDVAFTTFRNKLLPGEQEKWTLSVRNKQGEKEAAEVVATLYDASLDFFTPHTWGDIVKFNDSRRGYYGDWIMPEGQWHSSVYLYQDKRTFPPYKPMFPVFPSLSSDFPDKEISIAFPDEFVWENDIARSSPLVESLVGANETDENQKQMPSLSAITTSQNFNETAFFYPQLRTDENGEVTVEFTIPETLTRWKMLGFAHTKDLKVGYISAELITQKKVAISANAPRFFREKDKIELSAKVNNITDDNLTGQAMLQLFDATNMQPVDAQIVRSPLTQAFTVKAGESAGLRWTLDIPEGLQAITYKVTAQAGNHTDGEEKTVPVLTNTLLVTETMPFSARGGMHKTFTFNRLKENTSPSLRNHRLTLEYTSNPAWYAIQAMPYLIEYPSDCSEQVFSRFYANTLASAITNSSPRIKQIFDLWQSLPEQKDALLSNLEKNQELKQILIEETPWAMQANSETERNKRIGLLFDLHRIGAEQQQTLYKLRKMQMVDGGFQWFNGFPSDRFITQHIIAGIGHLQALNALDYGYTKETNNMVYLGLDYLDNTILNDYETLLKMKNFDAEKQHITPIHIGYLYACSFTTHLPEKQDKREAFDFYRTQAVRYWKNFNLYCQAATALALHRYGDTETAMAIIRSLKGRARRSEAMGMYWQDNTTGYFWYQAPVETQAILIEAFNEIANDTESVEEMKIWLLRQKQTSDWRTTKATTEACYALLKTGGNLLDESQALEVKIGGKPLASVALEEVRPESGSGYVKTSWSESDIQKEMVTLETNNPNPKGIALGGLYWQYFEQLDKITSAETNLQINKQLYIRKNTEQGVELTPLGEQTMLKIGDLVTVRIELRADRDYEFVHLKDMRASGFEPSSVLSGHRYQDGLLYYESIKDASTNFFISHLPKGTYILEYNLRATHAGEFSNGIATFQCMYAPEFSAHTEGVHITIAE